MDDTWKTKAHVDDVTQQSQSRAIWKPLDFGLTGARRLVFAAWLILYLLAMLGCVEPFPIWKKLDEAPFPNQVTALVTGSRGILSQQQMLTYGTWRVGFGKEAPIATADSSCAWQVRCHVEIKNLTCATLTGREEECSLHLDTLEETCLLSVKGTAEKIGISCPVDIVLARGHDKPAIARLSDAHH